MAVDAGFDSHCPTRRRALRACGVALALALCRTRAQAQAGAAPLDVPYVPTPNDVVLRMLQLAGVGRNDIVYDLGCGDGRLVIAAARRYGARGVGIDIDPARIREAQVNARAANVARRTEFILGDLFTADLSEASVVTLYLLPRLNQQLRPRLWQQLAVGARVVSHGFDMGDEWPPDRTRMVNDTPIHYWVITEAHKKLG